MSRHPATINATGRLTVMTITLVSLLSLTALPASAQQGEWELGARLVTLLTDESSQTITDTGTGIELDDAVSAELHASYMVLNDWALELALSGARVDLATVGGVDGGLEAGTAWMTPVTLTLRYHPPLTGRWHPVAGAGIGTAFFWDAEAGDDVRNLGIGSLDLSSELGYTAQLGLQYEHTDRLRLSLDLRYISFTAQPELRLANGSLFDAIDVDIDLLVFGIGVGYWF
jgi:outer membrane protein W